MTLHKLQEGFIVTSDESMLLNDICFQRNFENTLHQLIKIENEFQLKMANSKDGSFTKLKVIAQQDQIDFSALTEEEQKEIGWFDVDEFAQNRFTGSYDNDTNYNLRFGFKEGFQKAQELLSDRRFTLEDMKRCFFNGGDMKDESEWNHYIQSLSQPKSWQIEGEWVDDKFKITKI
jgi:hypothetical protein